MAEYTLITGRTEILAAIYKEENLPSALLAEHVEGENPYVPSCLHGLRTGPLETTESILEEIAERQGVDKDKEPEKIVARLYPFYEDYHDQSHSCIGCHRAEALGAGTSHRVGDTEKVARKLCEDCA